MQYGNEYLLGLGASSTEKLTSQPYSMVRVSPIGANLGSTEFSLAKIWSKEITHRLSHIYFAKVFAQVIWPRAFLSSRKG